MGWGKGKGKVPFGPGLGFGPGPWPHHHHHRHGPGPLGLAAEAAIVGGVAGAVVASTVARPARRQRPLPPQEVVVINAAPSVAPASTAYMVDGRVVRGVPVAQGVAVVTPPPKGKGKGKGKSNAAPQRQPLDVASVQIPAGRIEQRGDVTFFAVQLTSRATGSSWTVMRRYNDFCALEQKLGHVAQTFPDAPFPKKTGLVSCKGERLEARRRGLEVWLWRAIENPSSGGAWQEPLRHFLENGRQDVVAGSAPVHPAASAPPAPSAPPAEMPANTESDSPEGHDDDSLLQIQIPDGVQAGQYLAVGVPNGQQLTVQIPDGAKAGDTLELLYDASANTLTPIQ